MPRDRLIASLVAGSLWIVAIGCASSAAPRDTLYQVSVSSALLAGDSTGEITIRELLHHGNLGLGTSGEVGATLIVLDGRAYKVAADGAVVEADPDDTTPFAAVTRFRTDSQVSIDHPLSLEELEQEIDRSLDNRNIFYALRIETRVPAITLSSLEPVAGDQEKKVHESIKGTLVGFRSPTYAGTMTVPGYHWHFISADREIGGHVVAAKLDRDAVDIDHILNWDVALPDTEAFGELDLETGWVEEPGTIEE